MKTKGNYKRKTKGIIKILAYWSDNPHILIYTEDISPIELIQTVLKNKPNINKLN